jgi:hypothetical protein
VAHLVEVSPFLPHHELNSLLCLFRPTAHCIIKVAMMAMKRSYRILMIVTISVVLVVFYHFFNLLVLFPLFIPDYCYFDTHEIPFLVDVFFDFPAYEGYHPVSSVLGYLLFGITGA